MSTAVIVGTGLLGSSFGLAAKQARSFNRIIGVSSPPVVARAREVGAIDEALPLEEALALADLVVLAQPVHRILALLETIDAHLRTGTLVTDVGSTKARICAAAKTHITRGRFVGGHPMAGKEVRGPEGASADLFKGRPWILTSNELLLVDLVRSFGARPILLDAEQHDRMVAFSSHLPQLVSTALAAHLEGRELTSVAGPGVLDMTRLAQSSYPLWEDILTTNTVNIDEALAGLIDELSRLRTALATGGMDEFFERGDAGAKQLRS